jgi:hypothetical protein
MYTTHCALYEAELLSCICNNTLLSVLIFVTNLFDNCFVLCLSYCIFFYKFIGLKISIAITLNKSLPRDFYAMFLTFIEFPTIITSLILWVKTFLTINF